MFVRLLIFLIIGMVVYRAAKTWFGGATQRQVGRPGNLPQRADDALVQDPQCGVYLTRSDGIALNIDGQVLYFCSEACKEKYLAGKTDSV